MDQALNSQKTPHTSPLRASYGMSFVSILMKNDRVIKGFYCILEKNYHVIKRSIVFHTEWQNGYPDDNRTRTSFLTPNLEHYQLQENGVYTGLKPTGVIDVCQRVCESYIDYVGNVPSNRCYRVKPELSLIARFMGPTWGPDGADRT